MAVQSLFDPDIVRGHSQSGDVATYENLTLKTLGSGISSASSSFAFDAPGSALKNTQQIPLDWSKFENHTFFNSAESNVNVAFEKIINSYPFDGTQNEISEFFDSLTGFEKWVFDQFPKSKNTAKFNKTLTGQSKSLITVEDFAGSMMPDASKNKTGESVLDPGLKSIAIEFFFRPTAVTQSNSIVLQKLSGSNGISIAYSYLPSLDFHVLSCFVSSGSASTSVLAFSYPESSIPVIESSIPDLLHFPVAPIKVNEWSHILLQLNREPGKHRLELFVNELPIANSVAIANIPGNLVSGITEFGKIDFASSPLLIGSGSRHAGPYTGVVNPTTTLDGYLDDLRIYHATRSIEDQRAFAKKPVYQDPALKLYFKFNEPTGSYSGNIVVLDSSGNSLHGYYPSAISAESARLGVQSPLTLELDKESPVLFPSHPDLRSLNSNMLLSASQYDANNPNLITRLIPQHYLMEAAISEGFKTEDANLSDQYSALNEYPGGAQRPSAQIIASLLFLYAKFFDELKIYIDHMSKIDTVDYNEINTVANTFLPAVAKRLSFELPNQFSAASLAQYFNAQNISQNGGVSQNDLFAIQNSLWRRVLVSLPQILKEKGTRGAIKGIFNALGFGNSVFRFTEFGNKTLGDINLFSETSTKEIMFLNFSGSLAGTAAIDSKGFPVNKPHIVSPYLSGTRIEPGEPAYSTLAASASIGLFTSSSFAFESIYRFSNLTSGSHYLTQSLVRFVTPVSSAYGEFNGVSSNVVAICPDGFGSTGSLHLYSSEGNNTPGVSPAALFKIPVFLSLHGVNIFDGNPWYVSFSRNSIGFGAGTYHLSARQAGKQDAKLYTTSSLHSFLQEVSTDSGVYSSALNNSGSYFIIGSQSMQPYPQLHQFGADALISPLSFPSAALINDFSGEVSQIKFWSKHLEQSEIIAHSNNPFSLGVEDPTKNFCFGNSLSGSWEKLRVAVTLQQPITGASSTGQIELIDAAQTVVSGAFGAPWLSPSANRELKFVVSGSGFEPSKDVMKKSIITSTALSRMFDINMNNNKVFIENLDDPFIAQMIGAQSTNDIDYLRQQVAAADNRSIISISVAQSLDEDIIKIFGTLDEIENLISKCGYVYSEDYAAMHQLREIYFNRMSGKINITTFFDFFRFFDTTIESLIATLIPDHSSHLGTHFVVEPHMLERGKFKYVGEDIYMDVLDRNINDAASNKTNFAMKIGQ